MRNFEEEIMSEIRYPDSPVSAETVAYVRPRRRFGTTRTRMLAGASVLALAGLTIGAAATFEDDAATTAAQVATADDASDGLALDGTTDGGTDGGGAALGGAAAMPQAMPGMRGGPGAYGSYGSYGNDGSYGADGGATNGGTYGGSAYGNTYGSTQEEATAADDSESTGVVLIDTVLGYQEAEAAGTGMVLTSDGLVLTNNHVIEGSTEITVTIASSGETYAATVLGTDAEDDVALLQLDGASGLATVAIDDDELAVGDAITAVGNSEGGGVLLAADGTVNGLDSTVTTSSSYTVAGETLDGMIQFSADVVSGDSGGALLDDEGEVVGMTTAASSGLSTTIAFAVPIDEALAIVAQIQAGDESDGVSIGYPAFLGVAVSSDTGLGRTADGRIGVVTSDDGAQIAYVYADTPAADAGLAAGDTVTQVDGTAVTSGSELATALAEYEPGDTVSLAWTDASGDAHTADVTLIAGPA
ncbi:S1C family serine protease [Demequina pelophila]|uniref:S1C family serine protease n=1 Tax=Demequina pelophila TaxID=1638984 RepID=UPI000783935C|nr:trypsin-like peptidase domain-containing protein [Demequina pelophila]